VETLLVNREVIRSYRAIDEGLPALPWEARRPPETTAAAATEAGSDPGETARPTGEVAGVTPSVKPAG
jgi:hypothetical protein